MKNLIFVFIILSAATAAAEINDISFSEDISYQGNRKEILNEIERLTKKQINFKAQASFTLDTYDNEPSDVIDNIENILTKVNNLSDTPGHSKHQNATYTLFENITVLEDYYDDTGRRIITAEQTIPPFKPADIRYTIEKKNNFIMFRAENIENIRWWILPIITQRKLLVLFSAEIKDDKLKCYGLGTADTGSFFFMRKKLKKAFNRRTESLIKWVYKMLEMELAPDDAVIIVNPDDYYF